METRGPQPTTVRLALPGDATAITDLADALSETFVPHPMQVLAHFQELLQSRYADVFVLDEAGKLCGYVVVHEHPALFVGAPLAWVSEVIVTPDGRRAGKGSVLMHAAEEWARERGCASVALATRRAHEFYRAIGYDESAVFFKKDLA